MVKLLGNSGGKDFVRVAFERFAAASRTLQLAAPYFTYPDPILDAVARGSRVELLIGLNSATHPDAL